MITSTHEEPRRCVLLSGPRTDESEFVRLLAESLLAFLVHEQRSTYDLAVKLHVRDGRPVTASVARAGVKK